MKRRILAIVLALALTLSMVPAVVLAEGQEVTRSPKAGTHTDAGHSDDCGVTTGWQAWEKADSLPPSGNWYLTKDVTLTAEHTITGSLNLCLNGFVIKQTAGSRVMSTKDKTNMTVNICDCTAYEEAGTYYAGAITGGNDLTATGGGAIFARRGSMLHIYDGRITGNKTQTAGGAILSQAAGSGYAASNIYLHGGEYSNNQAIKGTSYVDGGVVWLQSSSMLEITGGIFRNNKARDGGVIYGGNNTVKISGATFTGNWAQRSGSVLHDNGSCKVTIGDGTVITGNIGANTNAAEGYSAAISMCGSNGKLTLSGKVTLAGNTTGATGVASMSLSKAASDTVYVNELAAGSYVEFCTPKTVPTAASEVVAVSGSQSSWTNGWIAHMGTDGKLQYVGRENGAFTFATAHLHTLCNDAGCTEHTDRVIYEAWGDDPAEKGKLPASGNWYLADNITVTAENQIKTATTLNLCLNGKTVTGGTGRGLRAYSTTANVATIINICDCSAHEENGEYKAGKFTGFINTHDNSGGGCIYIRKGGTLNFFDGIIENCVSATGGAAVYLLGAKATIWNGKFTNNSVFYNNIWKHGGGIYADGSALTMHGGEITDNLADWGGGIYFANGTCSFDMQGGKISENVARTNGGGVVAHYGAMVFKLSGDAVIFGNTLQKGDVNNVRLGGSGILTIGQLDAKAKVGINATAGRAFSNALSSDLSSQFPSDDPAYETFLNADNKLELKEKPAAPVTAHKHILCNDAGCTEHTQQIAYEAWTDATSLPASGNWFLDTDVNITSEASVTGTLNLCLNGHKVTGSTGRGLHFYTTPGKGGEVLNISDCTAKLDNGVYTAGGFYGNTNTHPGTGGGAIYIRAGGTLNFFEGIVSGNVTATGGGAFYLKNATATFYNGLLEKNVAGYEGKWYDGGALYLDNANVTIYNTRITGNEGRNGGGVYQAGNCVLDIRGGEITGNKAYGNGGGIQAVASTTAVKLSGDVVITGNQLCDKENNVNLGGNGSLTIGQLGANAKAGLTATTNRALSNALSGDLSGQFPSDDPAYVTVLNADGKLMLQEKITHIHALCNDAGCTDHTEQLPYKAWTDATSLPASGNWFLDTDVNITKEASVTGTLNLCLNGHKVTGSTGKGLHFYTTPGKGGEVLNISDCTAKLDNGVYTAGGFYGNTNTHPGTGGGAIYIRAGGTLNFFEGIVSGNVTATGGGAFYLKNATATFYNGLLEKNVAGYEDNWYDGGALYLDNANVTIYNTRITGNEARNGGGVYEAGNCVLDIRGGEITGNIAHTGGAGVYAVDKTTSVKLSGEPMITGNQLDNGKASNVCLAANGLVQISQLGQKASIGVTADAFRAISGKTQDYTSNFFSDDTRLQVIYQDEVLYMGASGDHKHCLCQRALTNGCDHSQLTFVEWDDPTKLPTSGNYFLSVDVVVSAQTRLEAATLNLCLNGHTVRVGDQGGRVYYMTDGAKLNITDCAGSGKITGATMGAVLTNGSGKDMELNLYAGSFTENHGLTSGGAIVIQGECTFNMYGGKITGNSANSYLKTDGDGKVILDKNGNQSFQSSNGGGLYVANGTFNMYGGEISKNKTTQIGYLKANATTETITGGVGGGVQITAAAKANLYGGKISGNTAYNGGGLFISGADSVLNLIGTEISRNRAGNGGGVLSQTHAVTNMSGGKVCDNHATISGAGVYVSTGTKFFMTGGEVCRNIAADGKTPKNGGGFFLLSSTLDLSGGKIWGNEAAGGAGIFTTATMSGDTPRSTYIYIKEGALITENKASGNGGAIMFNGIATMTTGEHSKLIMTGGEISKNTAKNAAGILVQTKTAMEMSGGKIIGNRASDGGGGVYASTGTKFTMTGGTINNNFAKNGGGGLFLLRATGIIKGGSISYNNAGNGGGIKNNGSRLDIYSVSIVDCHALGTTNAQGKYTDGNAGGLWAGRAGYTKNGVQMYDAPVINIYNMYLANCSATGAAGGILIQSQDTVFNMHGGTVTGNSTEKNTGGGLYLSTNVKANITGGTFSKNTAWNSSAIHVSGNNAQISGIKVYDNNTLNTAAITVTGKTTQMVMKNVELVNNVAAGHVGALVVQGYATLYLENAKISGNTAGGHGGGVFFSAPGYGTFKNVEISENTAGTQGGGVYVGNNSDVVFDNVTVRDNVAGKEYGGGFVNRGRLVIRNSKILNNEVKEGMGGGIATFKVASQLLADDAGVYVENTVISGNKASDKGGAINVHRGCPVYLTDCVITDNSSLMEGGAIYADGRLSMENVTVTGNNSGGEGFAVFLMPSNFDGHSYQSGHKRIAGDMIIKDNIGGDLYLSKGTILAVTGERLGDKSCVHLVLNEGVVSQWVYGVYHYEGGDKVYVLTAGDRSITDPEPYELPQSGDAQPVKNTAAANRDVLLYVGIGVLGIAAVAVVALIGVKKKKAGKTAGSPTKE